MPTPTPDDSPLAKLMAQGAAAAEQFQLDMRALDAAWAEDRIDAWVQEQIDRSKESAGDRGDQPPADDPAAQ